MKFNHLKLLIIITLGFLFSCSSDDANPADDSPENQSLHFSFNTPQWSRKIDCTHLDLDASNGQQGANGNSALLGATSQSTNATFALMVPADSSRVANAVLKKYPINLDYSADDFSFGTILNYSENSDKRMFSIPGYSKENSYNEITQIKYISSDNTGAYFHISGKYKAQMKVVDESTIVEANGTFKFKIKTAKK